MKVLHLSINLLVVIDDGFVSKYNAVVPSEMGNHRQRLLAAQLRYMLPGFIMQPGTRTWMNVTVKKLNNGFNGRLYWYRQRRHLEV